jgi:hypothetical protein
MIFFIQNSNEIIQMDEQTKNQNVALSLGI